jgi:Protein of unknown function (DUF4239)
MNIYWVYDLSNVTFALLCISFFVIVALAGLIFLRRFIQQKVIMQAHNDVVSFYMAGMNAIYGITLGLIAVGAWENFMEIDNNVSREASALAALYQDTQPMPKPMSDTLRKQIKEYVRYTIQDAWPVQRTGVLPHGGTKRLTAVQMTLSSYEPTSKNQEINLAEAYKQFNNVIELRRVRLQNVTSGLPAAIWYVIFFGGIMNIVITWFFITDKFRVHVLMTILFSALLGSLVFLVAAMDNPFRGEFSVTPEAFEIIMENMK